MIILHFLSFFLKSSGGRKNILKKITQKGIFVVGKKIQSNYLKRKPRKLVHFLNKTLYVPWKIIQLFWALEVGNIMHGIIKIFCFILFFTILETFQIKSKSRKCNWCYFRDILKHSPYLKWNCFLWERKRFIHSKKTSGDNPITYILTVH